jgi:hypothetical protein
MMVNIGCRATKINLATVGIPSTYHTALFIVSMTLHQLLGEPAFAFPVTTSKFEDIFKYT